MRDATAFIADRYEALREAILLDRERLLADVTLLQELGLAPTAETAVTHFGPAALARAAAAHRRESTQRRALEATAGANFAAQTQTRAAVVDLIGAGDLAELARRLDSGARRRFGLIGAVIAVESASAAPSGWRRLVSGQVDMTLGRGRAVRLGALPTATGLFAAAPGTIGSLALSRLRLWETRAGLIAFAAAAPDAFEPEMGTDLIAFLARVVERCAERWPAP